MWTATWLSSLLERLRIAGFIPLVLLWSRLKVKSFFNKISYRERSQNEW
jgi:hypothetical protein